MRIAIAEEIPGKPRLHAAVDLANGYLQAESPESGSEVRADWSVYRDDSGREGLDLVLSDGTDVASTRIPPAKLLDEDFLLGRIIRVWGDLLQKQSHTLRSRFKAKFQTIGDE